MKRPTVVLDRLTCAIAGGALIGLGLVAAAWEHGDLHVPAGGTLHLPWLTDVVHSGWWPLALGTAAVVLIALGLSWLISHRPGQTLGSTPLPGGGPTGSTTVDLKTAATAAATELARQPHVTAASGTSLTDRGQPVVELNVTIAPTAGGLTATTGVLDEVRRDLAAALDGVPVATRILLRTPRRQKNAVRVE